MKKMINYTSEQLYSILLITISSVLYGLLGYFGIQLLAQDNFSMPAMLFWRFFIAALWMIAVMFGARIKIITQSHPNILWSFIVGAICYSGASGFYFLASKQTGTGLAMVIFFTYPVFVGLLAWLVNKQVISKAVMMALLAIIIGLFCMGSYERDMNFIGIILAVIAALCYALYIVASKKITHSINSSFLTTIICLGSAGIFLMIALTTHCFAIPNTWSAWIYALALGIFATALPIQLFFKGLKHISPCQASILSVLEPVVTVIIGFLFLNEAISALQFIGICIILSSTLFAQFEK